MIALEHRSRAAWRSRPLAALGWLPWSSCRRAVPRPCRRQRRVSRRSRRALRRGPVAALRPAASRARSRRWRPESSSLCSLARPSEAALGLAAVIGIVRGAFLYRTEPARAVAERSLSARRRARLRSLPRRVRAAGDGVRRCGASFSCRAFSSSRRRSGRRGDARQADPFEEAYRRATALLERTGI